MALSTEHGELWEARVDTVRPVVIVSRDDLRGQRAKATVASVTSHLRDAPTSVLVDHREGFSQTSAINCDELQTIPKTALLRRIGRLSEGKIDALDHALRFAMQLR